MKQDCNVPQRSMLLPALVAAIGGFLFGYDLQVVSGAILYLRSYFDMTTTQEAWAMTSALVGCLVGPPLASVLVDGPLGRRRSLLVAAALFLVSAIGTALPSTLTQFNCFRFIGGIGVGFASVVSPMYIAELSPSHIRGRLVSLNQMMIVVGSFAAAVVTWQIARHVSPETSWRWMFASVAVPIIPLAIGLFFVPDSPRWLVKRGRIAEAISILSAIEGRSDVSSEINAMRPELSRQEVHWRELFAPGVRLAVFVVIVLAFFQQWTGVSPSTFYAPTIFEMAGLGKADAIQQLVIVNVINILCVSCAMYLVDRIGRRQLYLMGVTGMGLGMLLFGTAFHLHASGRVLLLTYLLGFGCYQVSLAPLSWLIMTELFSNRLRAKGMAIGSLAAWLSAMSSVYGLKHLLDWTEASFGSPGPAFWGFAMVCGLAWIFAFVTLPETRGISLEQVGTVLHQEREAGALGIGEQPSRVSALET